MEYPGNQTTNVTRPPPKLGVFERLSLIIVGIDEETLRRCPQHDWENARALALIQICVWFYQVILLTAVSHRLFAAPGEVRPELIAGSVFIASFILVLDSYVIMRSGWHLAGIEELKRGGLDISGGVGPRLKAGCFLAVRILLSVAISLLTAVFVSLLIFAADIRARVGNDSVDANTAVIAASTQKVDAEIQRATQALNAENDRLGQLSAQLSGLRQSEIDPSANDPLIGDAQKTVAQLAARQAKDADDLRAAEAFASNERAGIKRDANNSGQIGQGPRYRAAMEQLSAARVHAQETDNALSAARTRLDALRKQGISANATIRQQSHDRRPEFEGALSSEEAKVARLKSQLDDLTNGREDAIRRTTENSPEYVARDTGMLGQIKALEQMATEDSKIAAVIVLIEVTSFGLELAAVLAKVTSFVPTGYASLLAAETYMRTVRIAERMAAELIGSSGSLEAENFGNGMPSFQAAANDNHPLSGSLFGDDPFDDLDDTPPDPPKRPRGRPKKSSMN